MALAIATNNAALNAAASASSVNRDMETSMARLSSGKRINSASDDAAGVAISSRLSAEIRGTDQGIRNALDGQALIDTAEGAHKEIENILQRMREVSVQAANDTNNDQDRKNLQAEMNALITEIDRIAGTTTWAGEKLMEDEQGSFFSFQVGAATGDKNQIDVTIGGMGANILGFATPAADDSAAADDGGSDTPAATGAPVASISGLDLTIDGAAAADGNLVLSFDNGADISVPVTAGDTGDALADKIALAVNANDAAGDEVATSSDDGSGTVTFDFTGATGDYSSATTITIADTTTVAQAVAADDSGDDSGSDTPAATGAAIASIVGNTLTIDGPAAAAGDLVIEFSTGASDVSVTLTGSETISEIATAIAGAVNASDAGSGTATDNGDGTVTFDFSSAGGDYTNAVPSISSDTDVAQAVAADDSGSDSDTDSGSGDSDTPAVVDVPTAPVTSVATADDARVTIKAIDEAIKTVNIQRSELGAVSNRLSHTVNNLTNISSNLSAAQGGIEDADFAHETTMLAKNQILQQASTAMLAQANASKQNVLSLLQG
jgi:flagellin